MPQESLNSITTNIAQAHGREQDEPYKRVLAVDVDAWRSLLIVRSLERHPEQRKFFRQTLWVPMETVNPLPCPVPMQLCQVARSKKGLHIPTPMRLQDILFDYVGSMDGRAPFRESSPGTIDFLSAGRYARLNTHYEWTNHKIEIRQFPWMPMIRVDGIFDKPRDVMEFNCKHNQQCDYWDSPYPITGDLLQVILQYMKQGKKPGDPTPEIEVDANSPTSNNRQ